jgi:hypothetical protein
VDTFSHGAEKGAVAPTIPGTWRHWQNQPGAHSIAICCPKCCRPLCLPNHTVDAGGEVSPSVVCTHPGCAFHEHVALANYKPAGALKADLTK